MNQVINLQEQKMPNLNCVTIYEIPGSLIFFSRSFDFEKIGTCEGKGVESNGADSSANKESTE
jgi:hypothetical protein